ncbi:MAG: BatA domain-containing protein [Opitutaceae bacterium]
MSSFLPTFANAAGFWALLGVPAVLAIHFLQQRSRTAVISTLFLLETLAPESRGGRTWSRLRASRVLLLQLLAVLLATWVLTGPRWLRGESSQTVVVVLDSAVGMGAFRAEAVAAARGKLAASESRAAHTEWVVMTSDPRQPPLYSGPDRAAAGAALSGWRPRLGTHDYGPAIRLARQLAGAGGLSWFITDSRAKVPTDQPAVGVGHALANVGFAGGRVERDGTLTVWRALVSNHADTPQRRTWWVEQAGARSTAESVELPPGALVELSARFPDNADACTLVLEADGFAEDDRLPLIRPVPKALTAAIGADGETGAFFKKLLEGVDGVTLTGAQPVRLRIERTQAVQGREWGAAILLPVSATAGRRLEVAPVVPEKHPLVADLNWQGLLGPGPSWLTRLPEDEALLWQAGAPLVWLRPGPDDARQLVLNFNWEASNAGRLPGAVLLLRRFVERVRDAQPGRYARNFDTGERVWLREADTAGDAALSVEFRAASGTPAVVRSVSGGERAVLRTPGEAGFLTVKRGGQVLVDGAVQFADARQGDFRAAETFATGLPAATAAAAFEHNTRADPFATSWLALLGVILLGSWWPARRARP